MAKLIAAYIVEKDEECFELSFESVKDFADEIIIVDGNHYKEGEIPYYDWTYLHHKNVRIIKSPYDHPNKGANGKQRNVYLEHIKKHNQGDWCIVIDSDEVLSKPNEQFKEYLEKSEWNAFSVHMRHFVYCLALEDATTRLHFAPARLFRITPNLYYDEVEHPVLQGMEGGLALMQGITLWHFGYAREMFRLVKKYVNHLEKSNIHTPEYLRQWYLLHLTGKYPSSPLNLAEIPEVAKKYFLIEKIDEELYFQDRREPEAKHFIDAWTWKQEYNPKRMIEVGCGMGHRVFACQAVGMDAYGFDISEYAIKNTPYKNLLNSGKLWVTDISEDDDRPLPEEGKFDLVIAYDLVEHIGYEKIYKTLENIKKLGSKTFIFSIPFLGDPNLERDPTHKIKEGREWWIERLMNHGFKIGQIPESFLYKNQLIVAEI